MQEYAQIKNSQIDIRWLKVCALNYMIHRIIHLASVEIVCNIYTSVILTNGLHCSVRGFLTQHCQCLRVPGWRGASVQWNHERYNECHDNSNSYLLIQSGIYWFFLNMSNLTTQEIIGDRSWLSIYLFAFSSSHILLHIIQIYHKRISDIVFHSNWTSVKYENQKWYQPNLSL